MTDFSSHQPLRTAPARPEFAVESEAPVAARLYRPPVPEVPEPLTGQTLPQIPSDQLPEPTSHQTLRTTPARPPYAAEGGAGPDMIEMFK